MAQTPPLSTTIHMSQVLSKYILQDHGTWSTIVTEWVISQRSNDNTGLLRTIDLFLDGSSIKELKEVGE